MSWRGLRHKGTERLTSREWNAVVDSLNDLYGFLTTGTQNIYVDEVYGRTAHFRERIYCEGRPVILDGDPVSIYQFHDVAKQQITEAIDKSSLLSKVADNASRLVAIESYTREARDVLVKIKIDEYGNVGVKIAEPLDEYGRVVVSAGAVANPPNLDIALSALRDSLKPARSPVTNELSNYLLEPEASVNIDKSNLDGWSALVVTVRASYGLSPSNAVRIRWLYSPDGVNYDSPEDADNMGNYYELSVGEEAVRQATILVPILTPYIRIQIVNPDPAEGVSLSVWTLTLR